MHIFVQGSFTMRWHILGAGALGCSWAANLSQSDEPVTLILRNQARLEAFNQHSVIHYQSVDGTSFQTQCDAELASEETPIHRLIIATKAFDCINAFNSIQHRLSDQARIVLLQNGMGQQADLLHLLKDRPSVQIWSCVSTDGAYLTAPFHVVQAGLGINKLGCLSHDSTGALEIPLSLLKLEYSNHPWHDLWGKLAINAAINPMTALNNVLNGQLITESRLNAQLQALCNEIEAIAESAQQPLFEEPLYERVKAVAMGTCENISSMLQDVRAGRPTEIEYITGFILNSARKKNVPAPMNQALFNALTRTPQTH
jgi:2-dehydropantoate 2-reductase